MRVKELIRLLSKFPDRAEVRVHTAEIHDMEILSIYDEDGRDPDTYPETIQLAKFCAIDVGP